jgi:hypothetical protein
MQLHIEYEFWIGSKWNRDRHLNDLDDDLKAAQKAESDSTFPKDKDEWISCRRPIIITIAICRLVLLASPVHRNSSTGRTVWLNPAGIAPRRAPPRRGPSGQLPPTCSRRSHCCAGRTPNRATPSIASGVDLRQNDLARRIKALLSR